MPTAAVLTASKGTHFDRVALTWTPSVATPGAIHNYTVTAVTFDRESAPSTSDPGHCGAFAVTYRLRRSFFVDLGEFTGLSFDDISVPGSAPPAAPTVTATQNLLNSVEVSWTTPVVPPNQEFEYILSTLSEAGEEGVSFDQGFRATAAITHFELAIDGGAFTNVALSTKLSDTAAPAPRLALGATTVSDGTSIPHVVLSQGVANTTTDRKYEVRGVSAVGTSATVQTIGRRTFGPLQFQWQRSSGDADSDFSDLAGATTALHGDTTAPASGEGRWYRCSVAADGAETLVSPAVHGHRGAPIQTVARDDAWITNGLVFTIATHGDTTYLGGSFDYVGPPSGAFAAIGATTGAPDLSLPRIRGIVNAVAPDGAGGWYVGGNFSTLATTGQPRQHLVHIAPSGELDPSFNASSPDGIVHTLALSGTTLYVGGEFGTIGGQSRSRIAALDATTGVATTWSPIVNAPVRALAVSGNTIYFGGSFTSVSGLPRGRLAAVASNGSMTTWNPDTNGDVTALVVGGTAIYAGGAFTTISGQLRNRLAAVDAVTGVPSAWNPNIPTGTVAALANGGDVIYVGGAFSNAGGHTRNSLAAIDTTTGAATPWAPEPSGAIRSLAVAGNTIYAAGDFQTIGGQPRRFVAALDPTVGAATDWNPAVSGFVQAVAVSGNTVGAGGGFTSAGGERRNSAAAVSAATGQLLPWNPNVVGQVRSLSVHNNLVYAGGDFSKVGDQTRQSLAALDATTGIPTAWAPGGVVGPVFAIAATGSTVYAGGTFSITGPGPSVAGLAAFAATTGALAWGKNVVGGVNALAIREGTIYAGGTFTVVDNLSRNRLAAFDVNGGVLAWNPDANSAVFALAISGTTVFVGGQFGSVGGHFRSRLAQIDAISGVATAWQTDSASLVLVRSLVVVGGTLYAARIIAVPAYDVATGRTVDWVVGTGGDGSVETLASSDGRLYVGGNFKFLSSQVRQGLAIFDP